MLVQHPSPAGSGMSRDVSMSKEQSPSRGVTFSMDISMSKEVSGSVQRRQSGTDSYFRGGDSRQNVSSSVQKSGGSPRRSSRSFTAPSGASDSEDDSDDEAPSFSIQAPTGYSDGDSDDEEVTSAPPWLAPKRLRTPSPAQLALHELDLRLKMQLLVSAQQKTASFQALLLEIDEQEAADFARIEAQMQRQQAAQAGEEAAKRAEQSEDQKKLISGLQQEHTSQAQAMELQASAALRLANERRQQLLEAEQRKQEAAQRQAHEEAARKAAEDAAARRLLEEKERKDRAETDRKQAEQKAEGERQEQADREADAARRAEASSAGPASPAGAAAGLRIAPEAAEFERQCKQALQAAQEAAKELDLDPGKKSEKRAIFRGVNKLMTQLGGTQEQEPSACSLDLGFAKAFICTLKRDLAPHQVNSKSAQLVELLNGLSGGLRAYALLRLAQGFLDLSEGVESRYPVAEVAVAVCNAHQDATAVLLGKLHEACPLAVPKCLIRLKGEAVDDYRRRWGYQRVEVLDKVQKRMVEDWEDVDIFLQRVTAHIQFYAAFTQSDRQAVHGVDQAWSYLSRLLNALPPNRYTAFALVAFVSIAGFKLHATYRRQFVKLLMFVDQAFIEEIIQRGMEDSRSAVRRLQQYLQAQEYLQAPAGRRLAMYDASTYDRA